MSNYIPKKSIFDPNSNGEFGVDGEFGIFGGQYVPETLMPILKELEATYSKYRFDKEFWAEVNYYLKDYVGRENPLYFAKNISDELGAKIYLKREDLNHTGAHKVNNVIAQGLLAKKMGKILHHIAWDSNFRVFGTASKENIKSLKSYQAINNYKIIKELNNGYIYFEYLKSEEKPIQ